MNKRQITEWASRGARRTILLCGLLGIVGLGCVTIDMAAPKDERAVLQFLPNAEKGDHVAQYQMALSYRYGSSGVARDLPKAVHWMRAAAESGNVDAQFGLGDILLQGGPGVAPDPQAAIAWWRKAAERNLGNQLWLAGFLEKGQPGIWPADPLAARELFLKAAAQSRLARFRLGQMAEQGIAGSASLVQAMKWYRLAESHHDVVRLEKIMKRADVEQARSEAVRWQP